MSDEDVVKLTIEIVNLTILEKVSGFLKVSFILLSTNDGKFVICAPLAP